MAIPHDQLSLSRAAVYLREERNFPAAAEILDQAASQLGPQGTIFVPEQWEEGLQSPRAADVLEVVDKFRRKVGSA